MVELTQQQLNRLDQVFDFEFYEVIESARLLDDGWMEIVYRDMSDGTLGVYKPYFEKHNQEDKDKLNFILNGIKIERAEQ